MGQIIMDTLTDMIEAIARSDSRVKAIEYSHNCGFITSEQAVDGIVKETADIKKELQTIKKQFMLDKQLESQEAYE
jgi:hypothetical protein